MRQTVTQFLSSYQNQYKHFFCVLFFIIISNSTQQDVYSIVKPQFVGMHLKLCILSSNCSIVRRGFHRIVSKIFIRCFIMIPWSISPLPHQSACLQLHHPETKKAPHTNDVKSLGFDQTV